MLPLVNLRMQNASITSRIKKWIIPCVVVIPILCFTLGAAYFLHMVSKPYRTEASDVIVVFRGREAGTRAAYQLVEKGLAPALIVSPATSRQLALFDRNYDAVDKINHVQEANARTTFENALYTSKLIQDHGYRKGILVTSWDHMPRSYLLLKVMLRGTKCQVTPYMVGTAKINATNWFRHRMGWKMAYNELVETWGSLIELVLYHAAGHIPRNTPGSSGIIKQIKRIMLFDLKQAALESALHDVHGVAHRGPYPST